MEKIEIRKIARYTKSADGKPYDGMRISIEDQTGRRLSYFDKYGKSKDWVEGMTIEVEVKKNGDYFNIEIPKRERFDNEVLKQILTLATTNEIRIKKILEILEGRKPAESAETAEQKPIDENDLPF